MSTQTNSVIDLPRATVHAKEGRVHQPNYNPRRYAEMLQGLAKWGVNARTCHDESRVPFNDGNQRLIDVRKQLRVYIDEEIIISLRLTARGAKLFRVFYVKGDQAIELDMGFIDNPNVVRTLGGHANAAALESNLRAVQTHLLLEFLAGEPLTA